MALALHRVNIRKLREWTRSRVVAESGGSAGYMGWVLKGKEHHDVSN
jgi:hypothetical protein